MCTRCRRIPEDSLFLKWNAVRLLFHARLFLLIKFGISFHHCRSPSGHRLHVPVSTLWEEGGKIIICSDTFALSFACG